MLCCQTVCIVSHVADQTTRTVATGSTHCGQNNKCRTIVLRVKKFVIHSRNAYRKAVKTGSMWDSFAISPGDETSILFSKRKSKTPSPEAMQVPSVLRPPPRASRLAICDHCGEFGHRLNACPNHSPTSPTLKPTLVSASGRSPPSLPNNRT